MNLSEYESILPHINAYGIVWITPNQHCAWRVESLMDKEPDTIAWINTMGEGDILFDVGANMGQYSMLAARRGVTVHAFEPESQNFALLCRNIAINQLGDRIIPWPIALSDATNMDRFHVNTLMAGGSCNSLGEAVDYNLKEKQYPFTQGTYGCTMGAFARRFTIDPTHVKIDVDGFEHKVIDGMSFTTGGAHQRGLSKVKSILVETNTALPEHAAMGEALAQAGFVPDLATAEIARRKEGPFTGIGNVIWYKGGLPK